jgi:hypothetical protein
MTERNPQLSQKVIDLAWEAAQASDRAFDERDLANFKILSDMAATVMLLPTTAFNFQRAEIPSAQVPEIDVETTERLEVLPTDYRKLVLNRYTEKNEVVGTQINANTLPEHYRLPGLSEFIEEVIALAPVYEAFIKNSWEPEVVFVPNNLSLEQWDSLLMGHTLPNGRKSKGLSRAWRVNEVYDQGTDANPWYLAIVCSTERPPLTNVSPDGEHGSRANKTIRILSELPNIADVSSPEAIINQASPSEEMYCAFQLARLERGEQPVDTETWTIGKENISLGSLFFSFPIYKRQVFSFFSDRAHRLEGSGVRPSANGKGLVLG